MATVNINILGIFLVCAFNLLQSGVKAAEFTIPLSTEKGWQILKYRNIKPNDVRFSNDGLLVNVNQSANPIIYPFVTGKPVTTVIAQGVLLNGKLVIPGGESQGSADADDYVFKLGLVEKGDKSLNWIQRAFAPQWITTLFELAPEDAGISNIRFLNVVQREEDVGKTSGNSASDLMLQENVSVLDSSSGAFQIKKTFDDPLDIVALWLSLDGDDTKSTYSVLIKSIEFR